MGLLGAISGVIMAISKVPLAKAADVFGRAEAFAFAIFCYVLGLIIMCVVDSFGEYAAASVLYGLGQSGVYTLQQIVIADTTSLANRGVFSSLIDLPFIANIWIGPRLADHFKSMQIDDKSQWRWGLGMSIILIFVCSLPIILGLKWVEKRAIRAGLVEKKRRFQRFSLTGLPRSLWRGCKEFDVPGLLLLSAGIFLIVFPINYRTNYEKGWQARKYTIRTVAWLCRNLIFLSVRYSRNHHHARLWRSLTHTLWHPTKILCPILQPHSRLPGPHHERPHRHWWSAIGFPYLHLLLHLQHVLRLLPLRYS